MKRAPASVEEAIYIAARFSDVPLSEQASRMGVDADWLRDATDPQRKPRFPATKVVPLTLASQNFCIVRTICRDVGMAPFLLPAPDVQQADVMDGLGAALQQVGLVAEGFGRTVPPDDSVQRIDAALERLGELRALVFRYARERKA